MKTEQLEMKGILKNFTYLLICEKSGEAALIDPGLAGPGAYWKFRYVLKLISNHGLKLKYIINTHRHFDHIKGNRFFEKKTGAKVLSYAKGLREKDVIAIGESQLEVIETPGHTADGICLYIDKNLYTGDTLFVGDSGATISSDSDRTALAVSLRKLITLCPPDTIVWPGHDFGKTKTSTLVREQAENCNSEEYRLKEVSFGTAYTGS